MKKIDDGEMRIGLSYWLSGPGRLDDNTFNGLIHHVAMNQDSVCLDGAGGERDRDYKKEERQSFHATNLEANIGERCEYLFPEAMLLKSKEFISKELTNLQ